jgi:hypothetical protein
MMPSSSKRCSAVTGSDRSGIVCGDSTLIGVSYVFNAMTGREGDRAI